MAWQRQALIEVASTRCTHYIAECNLGSCGERAMGQRTQPTLVGTNRCWRDIPVQSIGSSRLTKRTMRTGRILAGSLFAWGVVLMTLPAGRPHWDQIVFHTYPIPSKYKPDPLGILTSSSGHKVMNIWFGSVAQSWRQMCPGVIRCLRRIESITESLYC